MQYLTLDWIMYCTGKENAIKDTVRSTNKLEYGWQIRSIASMSNYEVGHSTISI